MCVCVCVGYWGQSSSHYQLQHQYQHQSGEILLCWQLKMQSDIQLTLVKSEKWHLSIHKQTANQPTNQPPPPTSLFSESLINAQQIRVKWQSPLTHWVHISRQLFYNLQQNFYNIPLVCLLSMYIDTC